MVTDNSKKEKYRIANWNVERPTAGTEKTSLVLKKIAGINAEILVLTETSSAINLESEYDVLKSIPFERTPNEQWVTIWSKWNVAESISTFDPRRTVCGLINAPFGQIVIYGTIIPYHMAGVRGNRYEQRGYKAWQLHQEDIVSQSADWSRIRAEFPKIPLFVIGDFNQTRDQLPNGYGTISGRELLTDALQENSLSCLTEISFEAASFLTTDPGTGKVRRNIDHICVSTDLVNSFRNLKVGAWDHFTEEGKYMSDHNGVYIDFEIE